ncbi:hypothetical protein KIL84_011816, partial [Mauremys mutica]
MAGMERTANPRTVERTCGCEKQLNTENTISNQKSLLQLLVSAPAGSVSSLDDFAEEEEVQSFGYKRF